MYQKIMKVRRSVCLTIPYYICSSYTENKLWCKDNTFFAEGFEAVYKSVSVSLLLPLLSLDLITSVAFHL